VADTKGETLDPMVIERSAEKGRDRVWRPDPDTTAGRLRVRVRTALGDDHPTEIIPAEAPPLPSHPTKKARCDPPTPPKDGMAVDDSVITRPPLGIDRRKLVRNRAPEAPQPEPDAWYHVGGPPPPPKRRRRSKGPPPPALKEEVGGAICVHASNHSSSSDAVAQAEGPKATPGALSKVAAIIKAAVKRSAAVAARELAQQALKKLRTRGPPPPRATSIPGRGLRRGPKLGM